MLSSKVLSVSVGTITLVGQGTQLTRQRSGALSSGTYNLSNSYGIDGYVSHGYWGDDTNFTHIRAADNLSLEAIFGTYTVAGVRSRGIFEVDMITQPDVNEIAAAVVAALNSTTIPVDVKKMNSSNVIGTGQVGNDWRGEGVPPQ